MEPEKDVWKNLKSETPDGGFESRVRRRIDERGANRRRALRWAAVSAALAAAGIFLALVLEPPRPAPVNRTKEAPQLAERQAEPPAAVNGEDVETENEIAQILYDPDNYWEAQIDEGFQEGDENAQDGGQTYEVNPSEVTYS